MKTIGEQAIPLSQYKNGTIEGYLGTAYKATLSDNLKANPDTITYYTPFTKYEYYAYSSTDKALKRNVVDPAYAKKGNGFYAVFLDGDYRGEKLRQARRTGNVSQSSKTLTPTPSFHSCCRILRRYTSSIQGIIKVLLLIS